MIRKPGSRWFHHSFGSTIEINLAGIEFLELGGRQKSFFWRGKEMRLTTLANHYIRQLSVFKSFDYAMILVRNQAENPNVANRKN